MPQNPRSAPVLRFPKWRSYRVGSRSNVNLSEIATHTLEVEIRAGQRRRLEKVEEVLRLFYGLHHRIVTDNYDRIFAVA